MHIKKEKILKENIESVRKPLTHEIGKDVKLGIATFCLVVIYYSSKNVSKYI